MKEAPGAIAAAAGFLALCVVWVVIPPIVGFLAGVAVKGALLGWNVIWG